MPKKSTIKKIPDVKLHIWHEYNDDIYFGTGRAELLHLIDELGSLKLATAKMGISYRGAWGKIKKTEKIMGRELLYKGISKDGLKLTEFGKALVDEYKRYQEDITEYARKKNVEMFAKFNSLT